MELRDFIGILRRWWWLVVLLAVVGGSIAYLITPVPTPIYAATTTLLITQGGNQVPNVTSVVQARPIAATAGELMRTRQILTQVIVNLGINEDPEELANRINVQLIEGTNLVELTVIDADPIQAANIANELVRVFILQNDSIQAEQYASLQQRLETDIAQLVIQMEQDRGPLYQIEQDINSLETTLRGLDSIAVEQGSLNDAQLAQREQVQNELAQKMVERDQIQDVLNQYETRYESLFRSLEDIRLLQAQNSSLMSVVEVALPGAQVQAPSRKVTNALQGFMAGAVISLGILALMEYLQTAIKSTDEIEKITGLPTLGVISEMKTKRPKERLVTVTKPRSPIAEAYRVLRTNIDFSTNSKTLRTMVVTSSSPVEGKTTTVANLATAIAQSGKNVILVDTDLRRPSLHKIFEVSNTRGVTTALMETSDRQLRDHMVDTGVENLYLMPSGPLPPNPADLLGSQRMVELVKQLSEHADLVLFDSPPVLAVADANVLARVCDAAILVVMAGSTRTDAFKRAFENMKQSGAPLLGVVLNRVSAQNGGYYYQYYYSSENS